MRRTNKITTEDIEECILRQKHIQLPSNMIYSIDIESMKENAIEAKQINKVKENIENRKIYLIIIKYIHYSMGIEHMVMKISKRYSSTKRKKIWKILKITK